MPDYKKLKSAELEALLERRGLEVGGTKTEKLARLVKQDAEEAAAEKATAAAIRAASTNVPVPAGGRENDQGMLADSSKSVAERAGADRAGADQVGADRAGAIKKSEAMRKERLGKSKKGTQVSDASFVALGEGTEVVEKDPDVDEQAFLKGLWEKAEMNRGLAKKAAPEAQKGGIIVNMTSAPPTPRGRGRRTRWERIASPPFLAPNKDDGNLSDASVRTSSTIRPDGTVVPEDIAPPKDVDIVEKRAKNGTKIDKAEKKTVKTEKKLNEAEKKRDDAVINDSASVSDGPTALRGFFMVFPIVLLILCAYNPECLADILGDLAVCVKDPVGCLEECIMGPK